MAAGRTVIFDGEQAVRAAKALGSDTRLRILEYLAQASCTISQLASALGVAQPAVSLHIRTLEEAGLVTVSEGTGSRGPAKFCRRDYDEILLRLPGAANAAATERRIALSLPVGAFTRCEVHSTCGLASASSLIGFLDDPRAFYSPARWQAEILWLGWGFVEYQFANPLLAGQSVEQLELSLELCSEAPGFDEHHPSDITFSLNGTTVGQWTCPGDMGTTRGRLNPAWWPSQHTQHGFLKTLLINDRGTRVDGVPVSPVTIAKVLSPGTPVITLRLEVQADARYRGGLTLFGKSFGNYAQDIALTLVTR